MKARMNWTILGERNTAFFHLLTLQRRSKNKITSIQEEKGIWIHNVEEVQGIFLSYFTKLYQSEQVLFHRVHSWIDNWCAKLGEKEATGIAHIPSDGEIWSALKAMKPYKAPSFDGLHVGFFQRFWLIVGESVKFELKNIFLNEKVLEYLNQTLIVLIPKILGPETVGHYRPISLCNTVYKIVSKILVNRIRPLLPDLIFPMQSAFLEGRRSFDNVIIAQELIYSLKNRKSKDGFMVVKIDLEKAYDRLEWSFIKMVHEHFNFPRNIINLIMSCVTITSASILFNGGKLSSFQPSRGIKQGDPLSPFLFLLCIEFLVAQITTMCEERRWDKIKTSKNGPGFSHIFFADNPILFAKANSKNCDAIMEVLNNFCDIAGQKVNRGNSRIFFSSNVSRRRKRQLCRKMGIEATKNLGRYLGFPLLNQGRNGNAFNFVMERIQSKLAGWKTKLFSPAGRMVLVQTTAASIADYYISCHALPIKVCNAIDKAMRDFL